ncbi:MAG: nucleolar RNA-binding Nop10p family protein [Candidatus Korarchaeota archaeon]|nr:nucleolar RNA-binding Nop10p family protein [Candidatus Korarchaeota archaeon]
MKRCPRCWRYTFKSRCPLCGTETADPHPKIPKFLHIL